MKWLYVLGLCGVVLAQNPKGENCTEDAIFVTIVTAICNFQAPKPIIPPF